MVLEPPGGDDVDHFPFAADLVDDNLDPFVGIFEVVMRTECRRYGFPVQKNGHVGMVFLGVDVDPFNFTKPLDEFVPLEEHGDRFVACVTEKGHGV